MATSNPWLSPLQRSYDNIKQTLIANLKLKVPEITDFSEGNIFIILISLFAAIAEVLHYYIDNMARETFFVTARRYSSLKKHAALVDYHIRSAIPSMVDLYITRSDGTAIEGSVVIPVNTLFTATNGYQFISTRSVTWYSNTLGVSVPVVQKELRENIDFGTITSQDIIIQLGNLGDNYYYVEGSMNLNIGSDTWQLVDTFAYSKPTSQHYKVELDDTQQPIIIFGGGQFGMKPPLGSSVTGTYYVTHGSDGNLPANSINSVPPVVSNVISNAIVTNVYASVAGSNYEDFAMLKEHVPLSLKTLGVAITQEDYRDIAMLTPGVSKAYVDYICGQFIDIYVTPDGGGIAPEALLQEVYQQVLKKKVITTYIQILPAGVSPIVIDMSVTGRPSFKSNDIRTQIENALMTAYSFETSDVGKAIRVSDLYALIDNLSMVDFVNIHNFFLKPYARPQGAGNNTQLNITYFNLIQSNERVQYLFTYNQIEDRMDITRQGSGLPIGNAPIGVQTNINDTDTGTIFSITIGPADIGYYTNGAIWLVEVLPNNVDQLLNSYVIPVFNDVNDITINITEVA